MPRFGTSLGTVELRRRGRAAAWTLALAFALVGIGPAGASASTAGFSWGAQLPPRTSAELVVPIIDGASAPAGRTDAPAARLAERGAEPAVCSGCTPPLVYHGGVVMGTTAQAGRVTITPIYWVDPDFTMSTGYQDRHQPVPRRHRCRQRPEDQRLRRQRRVLPRADLGRRRSDRVRPLPRHPDRRHVGVPRAAVRRARRLHPLHHGRPDPDADRRAARRQRPAGGSRAPVSGVLSAGRQHHRLRWRLLRRGVVRHPRRISVDGPERTGDLRVGALPDRGLLRRSVPQRRLQRRRHVLRRRRDQHAEPRDQRGDHRTRRWASPSAGMTARATRSATSAPTSTGRRSAPRTRATHRGRSTTRSSTATGTTRSGPSATRRSRSSASARAASARRSSRRAPRLRRNPSPTRTRHASPPRRRSCRPTARPRRRSR